MEIWMKNNLIPVLWHIYTHTLVRSNHILGLWRKLEKKLHHLQGEQENYIQRNLQITRTGTQTHDFYTVRQEC